MFLSKTKISVFLWFYALTKISLRQALYLGDILILVFRLFECEISILEIKLCQSTHDQVIPSSDTYPRALNPGNSYLIPSQKCLFSNLTREKILSRRQIVTCSSRDRMSPMPYHCLLVTRQAKNVTSLPALAKPRATLTPT